VEKHNKRRSWRHWRSTIKKGPLKKKRGIEGWMTGPGVPGTFPHTLVRKRDDLKKVGRGSQKGQRENGV